VTSEEALAAAERAGIRRPRMPTPFAVGRTPSHVDLPIEAGLVREAADGDVVRFEATGAHGEVTIPG